MINTVLGKISPEGLGLTLMHEHIIWDPRGVETKLDRPYSVEEVTDTMAPYLLDLKGLGCRTLVEASPHGAGRDVRVLKACAERTGLNIITNCGMWDGGKHNGRYIPGNIKEKSINEIAAIWIQEFENGIEGTNIRPGFIKLALGDQGFISPLQEKFLRAAAKTSLATGLPIECHIGSATSAVNAVGIIEEEKLPLNRFIWIHIDWSNDYPTVSSLAARGLWVEIDAISAFEEPYEVQVSLLERLIQDGFLDRVLISQDAGCYNVGETKVADLRSYNNIFTKFIPICKSKGIPDNAISEILAGNPAKVLNIG